MSVQFIREAKAGFKGLIRRAVRNVEGVAAIEMVVLTPILLVFMMGTLEIARAINVDKRVNTVTSMAGDLIAREDDLGANPSATLDAIMEVVTHVMSSYDPAKLKLSVIPVMADAADETRTFVYATPYKYNGGVASTPAEGACYSFGGGTNVMSKGASVIVVKAEYDYEPLIEGFFDGFAFLGIDGGAIESDDTATYSDQSIHSPRNGCVDFDQNNCVVSTPGGC